MIFSTPLFLNNVTSNSTRHEKKFFPGLKLENILQNLLDYHNAASLYTLAILYAGKKFKDSKNSGQFLIRPEINFTQLTKGLKSISISNNNSASGTGDNKSDKIIIPQTLEERADCAIKYAREALKAGSKKASQFLTQAYITESEDCIEPNSDKWLKLNKELAEKADLKELADKAHLLPSYKLASALLGFSICSDPNDQKIIIEEDPNSGLFYLKQVLEGNNIDFVGYALKLLCAFYPEKDFMIKCIDDAKDGYGIISFYKGILSLPQDVFQRPLIQKFIAQIPNNESTIETITFLKNQKLYEEDLSTSLSFFTKAIESEVRDADIQTVLTQVIEEVKNTTPQPNLEQINITLKS